MDKSKINLTLLTVNNFNYVTPSMSDTLSHTQNKVMRNTLTIQHKKITQCHIKRRTLIQIELI